ncbi:MAG TPA: sigma 54-interacting transcriptional regulator [Thermoanaerobaculia bacterium]|nr:sigma 54-interacting transcriptional regulator [Thermoanaerobaculia bacterium]
MHDSTTTAGLRLVALSGPLAGRSFALPEAGLSIGRHAANDLQVRDMTASRQHCRIELVDGRLVVRDLESRSGTFVNGLPVEERELAAGDLLGVGGSQFMLLAAGAELPRAINAMNAVRLEETGQLSDSTVHLPVAEAVERQRQEMLAALPADSRAARDLKTLLEIGSALAEIHASEPLARRLLGLVLQAVPADRAALLLLDRAGRSAGELATAYALDRHSGAADPFPVSRTVADRVLREGVALVTNDAPSSGDLAASESVQAARIRSLLAVPLGGRDGPIGLLYLDSIGPGWFDPGHLRLLSAVAGIAAPALAAVRRQEELEAENRRLTEELRRDMIGESPAMREVQRLVARLGPADSTVLIRGESGTGKEVVARTLHERSARAARPFVAINCATLSETLLESELFGHEKGSFTGAVARKIGKFEVADTGTLFLDEIGELPAPLQAKLLRALEQREIERIGGTRPIKVDVRVLAATHRDLEQALGSGGFRADLFYRLNVISLRLPPLRERREDIPLLANHFAALLSRKMARPFAGFSPAARACLLRHDWPGNVRELANAVERALALGEDEVIWPEDLPETVHEKPAAAGPAPSRYHDALNEQKKRLILAAVEEASGNITEAAKALGLHPNYLHRLIRNLDLRGLL